MNRLCAIGLLILSVTLVGCRAADAVANGAVNGTISATGTPPGRADGVTTPAVDVEEGMLALYLALESFRPVDLVREDDLFDLDEVPLEIDAFLTQDDILSYEAETHGFDLTPEAVARLEALTLPMSGRAFVVKVGPDRIYAGAFWTPLSSLSFDGIVIKLLPGLLREGHAYRVELGYPGSGFFTGPDPRADPRIMQALEQSGRLVRGRQP
jgi:hypothetical protein